MAKSYADWLSSDALLAILLPLSLLVLGAKLMPSISFADVRALFSVSNVLTVRMGPFSLTRALHSYERYNELAYDELARMRASYNGLPRLGKKQALPLGYAKKLDRLENAARVNGIVAGGIAGLVREELRVAGEEGAMIDAPYVARGWIGSAIAPGQGLDLGRVRESLKHYVRDWSEEGKEERSRIFAPILGVLNEVPVDERKAMEVLVPGCGLGRLAWEISELGFDTTANELSYFMILAFRFLLSPSTTKEVNQHSLQPFAHWFSHQKSNEFLFRSIPFPDAVPRLSPCFKILETDFLTLSHPPCAVPSEPSADFWSREGKSLDGYDYIVTLFFIDTSLNVAATLTHIFTLLRPGGTWINLGPLLWSSGAQARLELSLEEVYALAEEIGFVFDGVELPEEKGYAQLGVDDKRRRRTVECEYTADSKSMMKWLYQAEFWVARKPK